MDFRPAVLTAAVLALFACASVERSVDRVGAAPETRTASSDIDKPLRPVSFSAPRAASSRPTGLVPCERGVFPAQSCWRRGDQHILYPTAPPDGIDVNADAAVPVSSRR